MIRRLRYWYRRLRGRCVTCGVRLIYSDPADTYAEYPNPYCCRWCNKRTAHGINYGLRTS